jgi:orotate phosphoribosyltransferase-like protein
MKGGRLEMKDVQDCITVKRLRKSGVKILKIAKQLHMSKNAVNLIQEWYPVKIQHM